MCEGISFQLWIFKLLLQGSSCTATGRPVNKGTDSDIVGHIRLVARNLSTHGHGLTSASMCDSHTCITHMHHITSHIPIMLLQVTQD